MQLNKQNKCALFFRFQKQAYKNDKTRCKTGFHSLFLAGLRSDRHDIFFFQIQLLVYFLNVAISNRLNLRFSVFCKVL